MPEEKNNRGNPAEPVKVSILIPVYKTAEYLPACLESVRKQTLKEIEIIAVNDASPDNAAEILASFAKTEPRLKIITHEKNGGILAARLSGIRAASGKYVICLDADDTLAPSIARAAWKKAEKTGADMVHFQFDVRMKNGRKTPFARKVEKDLAPCRKTLLGKHVFEGAFKERLYRWNICGKMISSNVFRKAAAALPPGHYVIAEDFCFYTFLSFFAQHYEPLFKKGYRYVLNIGVSAYVPADRKSFQDFCSIFNALNAVHSFLEKNGVFQSCENAFRKQERLLLVDLWERWGRRLLPADRPFAFDFMLKNYPPEPLLSAMTECFGALGEMEDSARGSGIPDCFTTRKMENPPGKTALFLDEISSSDRAAELLKSASDQWPGTTDSFAVITRDAEAVLSPGIRKITLAAPPPDSPAEERAERVSALWKLLKKENFDTLVYAEPEHGNALWDILTMKAAGCNVFFVPCRSFFSLFETRAGEFTGRVAAIQKTDAVLCFHPAETELWRSLGMRAETLRITPLPPPASDENKEEKHGDVLWLGSFGDSASMELCLAAFAKCTGEFPGSKLIFCSPGIPEEAERRFHNLLECAYLPPGRCELVNSTSRLSSLLPHAAAIVLGEDSENTAILRFFPASAPVLRNTGSAEELAAQLTDALKKQDGSLPAAQELSASGKDWREIFFLTNSPALDCSAEALRLERLLNGIYESSRHYEHFSIVPPRAGDTFFSFYRFFDKKLARWLPPGTPRRHYMFGGLRRIMRILFRYKG